MTVEKIADKMLIRFKVNRIQHTIEADPCRRLIDVLRDDLGLCGTKEGCGVGECGACTVLLNGRPVNSCLVFAGSVHGGEVTTIEGVADCCPDAGGDADPSGLGATLHPIQTALLEEGAVQCGFCTPGLVMNLVAFVESRDHANEEEIRNYIAGNLCRCTGYVKIVDAVQRTLERKRKGSAHVPATSFEKKEGAS